MAEAPTTMRAWEFASRGAPADILSLNPARPRPTLPPALPLPRAAPTPEEWILVRVSRAALNPGSFFHMRLVPASLRASTAVPEMDLAGSVVDVWAPNITPSDPAALAAAVTAAEQTSGSGVVVGGGFQKGDRVVAFLPISFTYQTGLGALAEYVAFPAKYAVKLPGHVREKDAVGVILAGCTAWEVLREARIGAGDRVLVNAASGGIGTFVVQMARHIVGDEGRVVGICSGRNRELVLGLGADEVIDYTACDNLSEELGRRYGDRPFDAVADALGIQALFGSCALYLRKGGIYASVGIKPAAWTYGHFLSAAWQVQLNAYWPLSPWLGGTGRTWRCPTVMDPGRELMGTVVGLLEQGKIKVVVDSEWKFELVKEAYDYLESRRARGKVVVVVAEGERR